jgi:hypothetical protein
MPAIARAGLRTKDWPDVVGTVFIERLRCFD